eukprot:scaffold90482_cov31-Tisochrysis_lutea.AAC.3
MRRRPTAHSPHKPTQPPTPSSTAVSPPHPTPPPLLLLPRLPRAGLGGGSCEGTQRVVALA